MSASSIGWEQSCHSADILGHYCTRTTSWRTWRTPYQPPQQNDSSRLRNRAGQMLQGLQICPNDQRFCMTNSMQNMGATACWTRALPLGKPQSVCNKWNSPWRDLPTGSATPTLVSSTSGEKHGWLRFWKRSISPLSGDKTVWNMCEMDPCTGRRWLQIFWRHWRTGCLWKVFIMRNGFSDSGLRFFSGNVQVTFGRRGKRECEATSDQWQIWVCAFAKRQEVTSQSCQIQLSLLWFVRCRMATITRNPAINSKIRTQMWGTGKSWLISAKLIVAWNNHTVGLRYTNAAWHRKN